MKLDFRALEKPSLEITLLDDDNTTIHVITPTHGMLKRLESMKRELSAMRGKTTDVKTQNKVYGFIAELMSVNEEELKITGSDLKNKYRLGLYHLFAFENAYSDFIAEIRSAKNS